VVGFPLNENVKVIVLEGALDEEVRCCDAERPFDGGLKKDVKRKLFDSFVEVEPIETKFWMKL